MDKKNLEEMKAKLIAKKAEIWADLVHTNEDFRSIAAEMDPKDFVDVASDDIDRKMLETIGVQDIKRIKAIDAALSRIEQGRYGLCVKCGKKIAAERLKAIPYIVTCINCQKTDERNQHQHKTI